MTVASDVEKFWKFFSDCVLSLGANKQLSKLFYNYSTRIYYSTPIFFGRLLIY